MESSGKQLQFTVDNTIFSKDDELLRYIQDNYVKVLPAGSIAQINKIQKQIHLAFPNFEPSIRKISQGTTFLVSLKNDEIEIELMYDQTEARKQGSYATIEGLIAAFREKIYTIQTIVQIGQSVEALTHFSFGAYFHGYSEEEEVFEFIFLNASGDMVTLHYYPSESSIESFCKLLRQFDRKTFVGEIVNVRNVYGQIEESTIDGFSLKYLEALGKKVKIEIID